MHGTRTGDTNPISLPCSLARAGNKTFKCRDSLPLLSNKEVNGCYSIKAHDGHYNVGYVSNLDQSDELNVT